MLDLVWRIIVACLVGAVAWLVCTFLGGLLASLNLPVPVIGPAIDFIGTFLVRFAIVIGAIVGLLYFFGVARFGWPSFRRTQP